MFPDNDKWCSHQCLEKAPSELVVYFDRILASSLILLPVFSLYQGLVNKRTVQQVNIWRTKSSDSARKSPLSPTLEVVELCKTDRENASSVPAQWEMQIWLAIRQIQTCWNCKGTKENTGVLTDGLEVPSKQYLEPVELLVGHLLGSQPRIGLGDANLHVLQTWWPPWMIVPFCIH
jgi:hypothetical protein